MPGASPAVFLSYASQDAEAARRICEALRAAGVEVWFDQSELVGGDAWDAKIRRQIAECALFVPVVSAATQARLEGYFRIEWKLAAQRTHAMAEEKAFLLPVVIDDTRDAEAKVPSEFRAVQWTRLAGGETHSAFCARVKKLLSSDSEIEPGRPRPGQPGEHSAFPTKRSRRAWFVPAVIAVAIALMVWMAQPWREGGPPGAAKASATPELIRIRQLADHGTASREDLALAVTLARRLTVAQPDQAAGWAWQSIAQSLQNLRGYDVSAPTLEEARRAAEHALSIDRQSMDAALAMGMHLATMVSRGSEVGPAEAYLKRATNAAGAELAHIGLAILYREAWRLDDVARECEAVLSANPRHQLAAYYLGGVRAWQRRPEEAARLRGMASSGGGLLGIRATVGWALAMFSAQADVTEMRRLLNTIEPTARLDARAVVAYWHAGYWERNGDAALQALGSLPDVYVQDNYFYGPKAMLVGLAHRLAGRAEPARAQFEEAERVVRARLRQDPNDEMARLRLAQTLALLGRGAEARRELETQEAAIAARPPSLGRVMQRGVIGKIHAELGDVEPALPYLRELLLEWNIPAYTPKAFAADPDWDRVRDHPRVQAIVRQVGAKERQDQGGAKPVAPEKSVAVLAFENDSGDKANEYFSDGISEELLNVLVKVPGLTVRGRSSGFYFKGKQAKSTEIGQQLGVTYLVQGSVRRSGERVRISAQLIRAATDEVVWSSGPLDRELKDIFAVQDEIAGLIAQNLELKLMDRGRAKAVVDPEGYRLVLEGRHFMAIRGEPAFAKADRSFRAAIAIAPSLAIAHSGLAELVALRGRYRLGEGMGRTNAYTEEALTHARRALDLDPTLADAHAAMAIVLTDDERLDEAQAAVDRAIALNPNHAAALNWHSQILVARGRIDLAMQQTLKASALDPFAFVSRYIAGAHLTYGRRHEEALAHLDRAKAIRGETYLPLEGTRVWTLLELGRTAEAMSAARALLQQPDVWNVGWWAAGDALYALRVSGAAEEARRTGDTPLSRIPAHSYQRGYVLCALGRFDEGISALENTPLIARTRLFYVPMLDEVRDTPAFQRLMEKLHCAAEHRTARETLARMLRERTASDPGVGKPEAKK